MPFNFIKIISESAHFISNRMSTVLTFVGLFTLSNISIDLLIRPTLAGAVQNTQDVNISHLMLLIFPAVADAFITVWFLCSVHFASMSNKTLNTSSFALAIKRFLGYVVLVTITVIPLSITAATSLTGSVGFLTIISLFIGIYIYLRLCLAPYAYVLDGLSFINALKFVWLTSFKYLLPLLGFVVITQLIPMGIANVISHIFKGSVGEIIISIISAIIKTYIVIFTYRFYSIYKQNIQGKA